MITVDGIKILLGVGNKLEIFSGSDRRPKGSDAISSLLTCNTAFKATIVCSRALGSLFHVIQDPYAHGHAHRRLINPKDKESGTGKSTASIQEVEARLTSTGDELRFKPGI